MNDIDRT
jgi:hypothetical protein